MWIKLGDLFLGPLIESWRAVREIERDLVKGDGDATAPVCTATEGRFGRRRRCELPAFHPGEHEYS